MSLMVSISGIRGIVGQSLTPEVIVRYAAAFAEYTGPGTIIVGRDGRITGHSIAGLVTSTLVQMGRTVVDLGICPTPTVGLAVERYKASGGIAITASHNPMIWNGMKFIAQTGMFLNAEENNTFWNIADRGMFKYVSWEGQGILRNEPGFIDEHIAAIVALPYLDIQRIRRRKIKVVVDCVNASGGLIVPKLLREFGCEVIEMYCDASGVFAHTPEPLPENLTALAERVVREKADVGFGIDPDADRLVMITDEGRPFIEEYTIVSAVKFILGMEHLAGRSDHSVVVNLSTTRAVDDIAAQYGATVYRTPVGEINVASRMKQTGSIIGGEGSGGVILPQVHLSRDAMVGIGLFLQLLTDSGCTSSQLKADLPQYDIVKNKIDLGSLRPDEILKNLHLKFSATEKTNMDDGLKIDFPDSWVHLRKSNTEPIIRIIAEARTRDEAARLVARFQKEITG
jgi:phosphomannomutase